MPEPRNAEQALFWNEQGGAVWVSNQERLDRQLALHGARALDAAAAKPDERVLDVGCGCGATSLELARRVGKGGHVLGVDVSAPMLARARERAAEARLANLEFREADAQTQSFPAVAHDLVFSRFGVMFFDDPVAAFRNLHGTLRPGGRLVFVCWQPPQGNPWVTVPMAAVAPLLELPPPPAPGTPGMFAFGDDARVRGILEQAGFDAIAIDPVELPMKIGDGHLDDAVDFFLQVGPLASLLRERNADPDLRTRVEATLRTTLAPHLAEGLPSALWLTQATRP